MPLLHILQQPWPWYVAGPLIGLTVPLLLWLDNKPFGISSNLRHICAACIPSRNPFFKYNWRKESWNLFFAAGTIGGGFLGGMVFNNPEPISIHPDVIANMKQWGINDTQNLVPGDLFAWSKLFSLRSLLLMVVGGFLVGFGTRYAGGCTSGHAITGLSNLQWPSLVATICFMAGGFLMSNVILPFLLSITQ
jgi:uncharacterized membrane protein YedE/YeeE